MLKNVLGHNLKMRTKIILSFIIIAVCVLFLLWSGYTTAQTIITVDDPVHYLGSYAKFTAVLAIVLFAGVRERLETAPIPKFLQGFPIVLISAALISMAFVGLSF